jgi:integrase
VALHTGCRSGELQALEWRDVNLEDHIITISKNYNGRFKTVGSTKGGYWRDIPINEELERLLRELRSITGTTPHVLPRFTDWKRSEQARVLKQFCLGVGITPVVFHALRACFATQMLRQGVAPITVMKIGGWKDLKVMQRYVRLAGIEVQGATERLKFAPAEAVAQVVALFRESK